MELFAKIILAVIFLEGLWFIATPGSIKESMNLFTSMKDMTKRAIGVAYTLAGCFILYLTRVYLEEPLTHWIVAVCGLYMIFAGTALIAIPILVVRFMNWFFDESGPTRAVGGIMVLMSGIIFFLL
ncbi:DUF2065 family protein [Elusimicrobiota bacterium]